MGNYASDKRNAKFYGLKLSLSNDKDIIDKLAAVESVQGYIKALIRADIMKEDKPMKKYCVELTSATGATEAIDNITAPEGYTADDYIRDCDQNADPEWCEMLHAGTVALVEVE